MKKLQMVIIAFILINLTSVGLSQSVFGVLSLDLNEGPRLTITNEIEHTHDFWCDHDHTYVEVIERPAYGYKYKSYRTYEKRPSHHHSYIRTSKKRRSHYRRSQVIDTRTRYIKKRRPKKRRSRTTTTRISFP